MMMMMMKLAAGKWTFSENFLVINHRQEIIFTVDLSILPAYAHYGLNITET